MQPWRRSRLFDEAVLFALSRVDELKLDTSFVGPLVERPAGELRAVFQHDLLRRGTVFPDHPIHHTGHP